MREDELKAVVDAVMKALEAKGVLKGACGCAPGGAAAPKPPSGGAAKAPKREVKVTVGTAGKVFPDGALGWRPSPSAPAATKGSDPSVAASRAAKGSGPSVADDDDGHTAAAGCPHCEPLSRCTEAQLRELGADRVGVCHPSKQCTSVARLVDHTLLKPNATQEEVARLCAEAKAYCFASVCVNPSYVALSARLLQGSGVKVCTVVGFPLGSTTPTVKAIEARDAIANGAGEIDMVMNVGALKSGNDAAVLDDMKAVREATRGRVLKVILETSLLTREEKVRACLLAKQAGADFVKTSTGFGGGGATAEDIRLMRETVGPLMGVKASGGIRDAAAAQEMIAAGATRLGTSASIAIVSPEAGSTPLSAGAAAAGKGAAGGGKY